MKQLLKPLLGVLLGALIPLHSALAQAYPNKPIKLIIPYTPGGSIDTVGRMVADQLQKQLGQAFVIENRPGASGMIGSELVARAPADGYTLLFNASSQAYMPLVVARKTYDAEKDFTAIAQVGYVPLAVVTHPAIAVKTLADFVNLARANPKKYTWATSGLGTTSHLAEEIFKRELNLDMEIIIYKGAVPQLTDVMGGTSRPPCRPCLACRPSSRVASCVRLPLPAASASRNGRMCPPSLKVVCLASNFFHGMACGVRQICRARLRNVWPQRLAKP